MDHSDPHERLEWISENLLGAYRMLEKTLQRLPLPLTLSPLTEDWEPGEALVTLQRARTYLEIQPMDELTVSILDKLVLEWFTVYELGGLAQEAGVTPWRLDAAEFGLLRFATLLQVLEERFDAS
ncbi:hypothetical protein HNP84_007338 [Thermocatellispora tengchongensis]|uniref:Uncharacterized protein n=1 Tax=Thermocatellispora tengchongensis TaxID=1073253 RepID=A0A840PFN5_9ACTN|nr:hypothetical protein [Thermocatellispora tengchongensis]MBB5137586.1 hypothetical protein [Thermocatellispora tengchongensis]